MASFLEIAQSGESVSLSTFVEINDIQLDEQFSLVKLLEFEGNEDRIKAAFHPEDILSNHPDLLVHSGVLIRIPVDRVLKEVTVTAGNIVVPNESFDCFIDDRIREIIGDTDYSPVNLDNIEHDKGKTFRFVNEFTVWVWCKALGDSSNDGKLINVTPFIQSVTTNVGKNGGNFNFSLSPITGEINKALHKWRLSSEGLDQYAYRGVRNITARTNSSNYLRADSGKDLFSERLMLFHNIIQSNDVVFIKFETLESEKLKRDEEIGSLNLESLGLDPIKLISGGKKKKQIFDMIGLVDTNSQSKDSTSGDVSIQIAGRDLMKLLLEDGQYFFPTDIAGITGGIQGGGDGKAIRRLVNGDLNFFNSQVDRTIDFSIRFVFNLLSNIEICNDELFVNYGDDRTFRYDYAKVTGDKTPTEVLEKTLVEGIWQIVKLVIDPKIQNRRIVDSSIISDQGSLKSYIDGKVVHEPFVEFYGDTYGNQYYFMVRKPPFNRESIKSNAELAIDIYQEDIYREDLSWSDESVFSWYRIIPRGNFFGDDESLSLTYFPAIFFEEYAKIWGSKPFQIVSNYIDYNGIRGSKHQKNLDFLVDQAYQDLAFVIQSNAYLPFSRKGTIIMKGDRRIKRGNMIRHQGTGEIFYVESVSNSANVNEGSTDRVTQISVSRGLKEKYVEGVELEINGARKKVSYFTLINMQEKEGGLAGTKDFKVDRDVFDFFLRRLQMDNADNGAFN